MLSLFTKLKCIKLYFKNACKYMSISVTAVFYENQFIRAHIGKFINNIIRTLCFNVLV